MKYLMLIFTILCWGLTPILEKKGLAGTAPLVGVGVRTTSVFLILIPTIIFLGKGLPMIFSSILMMASISMGASFLILTSSIFSLLNEYLKMKPTISKMLMKAGQAELRMNERGGYLTSALRALVTGELPYTTIAAMFLLAALQTACISFRK